MINKKKISKYATNDQKLNNDHKFDPKNRFKRRSRVGRRTKEMVEIAKERTKILLSRAENEAIKNKNIDRANRYVLLAKKIAMRYNIRINKYYRYKLCRVCNTYLGSSTTSRIRFQAHKIIIYCKNCGNIMRIPLNQR